MFQITIPIISGLSIKFHALENSCEWIVNLTFAFVYARLSVYFKQFEFFLLIQETVNLLQLGLS